MMEAKMIKNLRKILVVEDDQPLSEMYNLKLKDSGYEVAVAKTGKEALKKLMKNKFDLVLLDIILPEVDGWGVLDEIKKENSLNYKTPVILLTNLGDKNSIKKGDSMGVENYLIKAHFTPQEVVDKIREVLKENNSK